MATRRAVANGNWSSTSTWNGGVLPGNGDTVYANGFNVTLDTDVLIGGPNNPTVATGSLVSGQWYEIVNVGGQAWTSIGASSNATGTVFQATGTGTAGNLGTALAIATLTTASNTAAGATTGGGGFTMSTASAMNCDLRAGATTCLSVTGAVSITLSANRIIGGSVAGANAFAYSGTGTLSLNNGCILNGGTAHALILSSGNAIINSGVINGGNQSYGILNTSNGSININNSSISGGGANGIAINNNTNSGSIVVSASTLIGGANGATAITNTLTGSVSISNSTITGSNNNTTGPAISNIAAGTLSVTSSDMIASAFVSAIIGSNTSAIVNLSGNFYNHWQGIPAVYVAKWKLGIAPTLGQTRYALAGTTDSYHTQYGADYAGFGNPVASDVRSGVSYGGGNLLGTCAVPNPSSVSAGVPIDATVGTAILTAANVRTALGMASANLDTQLAAVPTASANASAVWSAATRTLTADIGPTAVQIRQELDSNSSRLANLDTTVSSRLAPSGTLATVTNLTNAPASVTPSDIWSHASRTLTSASGPTAVQIRQEMDSNSTKLANLDTTVSSRLAGSAYTAPTTPPTPAAVATQVRTELGVELSRIDQAISTRATPASIPSADITAIKAKTDLLNTTRLAQVSTTEIVGGLLAQANS